MSISSTVRLLLLIPAVLRRYGTSRAEYDIRGNAWKTRARGQQQALRPSLARCIHNQRALVSSYLETVPKFVLDGNKQVRSTIGCVPIYLAIACGGPPVARQPLPRDTPRAVRPHAVLPLLLPLLLLLLRHLPSVKRRRRTVAVQELTSSVYTLGITRCRLRAMHTVHKHASFPHPN